MSYFLAALAFLVGIQLSIMQLAALYQFIDLAYALKKYLGRISRHCLYIIILSVGTYALAYCLSPELPSYLVYGQLFMLLWHCLAFFGFRLIVVLKNKIL